ncbi:DUF357 domain-containing protein [Methanocorpusculum vombati]|uniref:DUF357 domain-containing protein n=1 Tax=Methanocorpusculum vombati TaxID=3002864 RepID=A0ABT4IP92_9EURY|nr:DUF357 domain-containing protein [Methanocorpusculum vombati]MCZ9319672.1 DUF357 domain-containing protein [Methanocorpusculum sp.]MCZ0862938.1 DUF357 domain-containing protein [Methanocorpusculum vombati]MDE2520915.1 DUF357 domain-containing protein [Methanocorpusculum sp.]MDE2533642.1 DUF357 domain-containing protein [Methanocorpusculum sp.]MDE2546330.1 DUF357 domain-containing protein [Methanocorpusculum sp.]
MLIESYGTEFAADAGAAAPAVPAETPLGATAAEMLEMVRCYASDGMVFYRQSDPVNAVASFAYGYGWLDAGVFLGYLQGRSAGRLPEISEEIPSARIEHLTEKTHRYQRMLSSALAGVVTLPDAETRMWSAAQYLNAIAVSALTQGGGSVAAGDLVAALVSFSYGYGWLDCGVRAGLFGIVGDRDLFTI